MAVTFFSIAGCSKSKPKTEAELASLPSPPQTAAERDVLIDQILERSGAKKALEGIDRSFRERLANDSHRLQNSLPLNEEESVYAKRAHDVWAQQFQMSEMYDQLKRVFREAMENDYLPAALQEVSSAEWAKVVKVSTRGGYDDLPSKERLEQILTSYPPERLALIKQLNTITGQGPINIQLALTKWVVPLLVMESGASKPAPDDSMKRLQEGVEELAGLQSLRDLGTANSGVTDDDLRKFVKSAEAHPATTNALRQGLIAAVNSAREKALADIRAEAASIY
jgi:hypothetical protein